MAVEDLDALEATLELLRDPAAQRRIAQSEAEITRGEWLDEAALRAMVRRSDLRPFESPGRRRVSTPRGQYPVPADRRGTKVIRITASRRQPLGFRHRI
jgi:hypothetical protein